MDLDEVGCNDDYNYRERSNTWPSIQQARVGGSLEQLHQQQQFSPSSQCSSRLSYILESNESLNDTSDSGPTATNNKNQTIATSTTAVATTCPPTSVNFQQGKQRSSPSVPNYKAGHPSYVELITSAILSSPEKRMTLSEIYDWMVTNVSAFKDQRHLHSSAGWKNSVRHNLSLHSRFKRVKRNGMDKPSWWTVDLTEQSKDRKQRTTKQTTVGRSRANTTAGTMYHQSPKIRPTANQQNAVWSNNSDVSSSMGRGTSSADGHYTQLTAMADPFIPQVTTLHQGELAAVGGGGDMELTMYNYKDESPASCSPPRLSHSLSSAPEENDSAFASNTSLEAMEMSGDVVSSSSMNLHRFAQAITVTLRDQTTTSSATGGGSGGMSVIKIESQPIGGNVATSKPDIALQITGDMTGVATTHASYIQKQLSVPSVLSKFLKPSSAEDSRQMLRVQTNVGNVQDVAVPAPLPIRVVIHTDKEMQTDDLETALEYGLQIRSPNPCHQSSINAAAFNAPLGLQQRREVQYGTVTMITNSPRSEQNSAIAGLPDDLASLNVEGDMHCNIMDVLQYEMCCNNKNEGRTF